MIAVVDGQCSHSDIDTHGGGCPTVLSNRGDRQLTTCGERADGRGRTAA